MPRKRPTAEQIIGLLRQAEVELAQGRTVGEICRGLGISEARFYRWRSEYGGLKVDQARRLKDLERENARLKRGGGGVDAGQADPERGRGGKLLSPERRRAGVRHVQFGARDLRAPGVPHAGPAALDAARQSGAAADEAPLTEAVVSLAASMAATATAGSRRCCGPRAGG